jgi:FGFR1 oncogene partner
MSASSTTEDDTEQLRDLVAATLEKEGVLGKIKAQLRAHVYLALEARDQKARPAQNPRLTTFLSSTNGRLVASLVREFLQFFDLEFSLAVFDPETNIGRDVQYRERERLCSALGLTELTDPQAPLLSEMMRLSKVSVLKSESPTPSSISDSLHTSGPASLAEDPPSRHTTPETPRADTSGPGDMPAAARQTAAPSLAPLPSAEAPARPPSFLSDLPPLGRPGPPPRGGNLAPLRQARPLGSSAATDHGKESTLAVGKEEQTKLKKVEVSGEDTTPDVTENIEEELDSFLNSDISDANDVTKDETLANSDISL